MTWKELFNYNIGFPIKNYSYADLIADDKKVKETKPKEEEHPFKRISKRSNTVNYQQQGLLQQRQKPTQDIVNEIKQKYSADHIQNDLQQQYPHLFNNPYMNSLQRMHSQNNVYNQNNFKQMRLQRQYSM
jgi:hypothetical protein